MKIREKKQQLTEEEDRRRIRTTEIRIRENITRRKTNKNK